jgi:hypothetical protein
MATCICRLALCNGRLELLGVLDRLCELLVALGADPQRLGRRHVRKEDLLARTAAADDGSAFPAVMLRNAIS